MLVTFFNSLYLDRHIVPLLCLVLNPTVVVANPTKEVGLSLRASSPASLLKSVCQKASKSKSNSSVEFHISRSEADIEAEDGENSRVEVLTQDGPKSDD